MQKQLKLLLDLLEIDNPEECLKIVQEIETYKDKKLLSFHRNYFIFQAYHDLLNNKISLEEFLTTGDITGKVYPQPTLSPREFLESLIIAEKNGKLEEYKNTLIILEDVELEEEFIKSLEKIDVFVV